jgi:regulator of protease activity HflC (stomatin/prohibitin superfamily)
MDYLWLTLPLGILIAGILYWRKLSVTTVYEFQKGLMYRDGKLAKIVDAGTYHYLPGRSSIEVFDMRNRALTLSGQEILTKDNIGVRVTVVGSIQIIDPVKSVNQTESYMADVYALGQLAVRDALGSVTVDEFLANKPMLDAQIQALLNLA